MELDLVTLIPQIGLGGLFAYVMWRYLQDSESRHKTDLKEANEKLQGLTEQGYALLERTIEAVSGNTEATRELTKAVEQQTSIATLEQQIRELQIGREQREN